MNSLERIRAIIEFQPTDRPAVAPEVIAVTATAAGAPVRDYVRSGAVIAECQAALQRRIDSDVVFAVADLCVEAEALGCPVEFPDDNYPSVTAPVLAPPYRMDRLAIPDPRRDGRMPEALRAVRLLKEIYGGRVPVVANAIGPITLASRIMDVEKMLYMIVDEPERFRDILSFCLRVSTAFAEEQARAGADGIMVFDPMASATVLPPKVFRQFEAEPVRALFAAVRAIKPDIITWYSVAGPAQTNPALMTVVAADITTVDYLAPIETAMRYAASTVINGNLMPALFLEGEERAIYSQARALLAATREKERFILGSGCEIPLNSPVENIAALGRAARDELSRIRRVNGPFGGSSQVTFLPSRARVYVRPGASLMEAAQLAGVSITAHCGLNGSCGACVVETLQGELTPLSEEETLNLGGAPGGARLACQARPLGEVTVYVPHASRGRPDALEAPPELYQRDIDIGSFRLAPLAAAEITEEPSRPSTITGLALDITPCVTVAYTHDLADGALIAANLVETPRLEWMLTHRGDPAPQRSSALAQRYLLEQINHILSWLHHRQPSLCDSVREIMVSAGGDVARELFRGARGRTLICAKSLSPDVALTAHPDCRLSLMPGAQDGAGADTVAAALAAGVAPEGEYTLIVNVAGGGSVILGGGGRLLCAPVAAGYALERPMARKSGHGYSDGLIYQVRAEGGRLSWRALGDAAPVGALGSAMVDVLAAFRKQGIIDDSGRFSGKERATGVFVLAAKQHTALYSPICITQADIAAAQKAKASYHTAITILLRRMGIGAQDVRRVILSGAPGALFDLRSASAVGLLPAFPRAAARFIPNLSGMGARLALLSADARERAAALGAAMTQQSLYEAGDFPELMVRHMSLAETP